VCQQARHFGWNAEAVNNKETKYGELGPALAIKVKNENTIYYRLRQILYSPWQSSRGTTKIKYIRELRHYKIYLGV
jgi:hypothetical protein